jgi:glycosyltransferase involved in cell wall biosynthesis
VRVAVVVYGALDERSGGFLYDRRVADGLRARGDTVVRVSLPEDLSLRAVAHGFDPRIRRRLRRLDADVVVADELCHRSLAFVDLPGPTVALVHHLRSSEPGPPLRRRVDRALERRFLARCDAYICNGSVTRDAVADLVDPTPAAVAPPGADRLAESPVPPTPPPRGPDAPLRLCTVGTVLPRKGHATLLDGLAAVDAPWRLDVVGAEPDPGYAAALRARAAALGVTDRVRFHGRVSDAALRDRLVAADAFAMPSTYEGYGIAYVEAMWFGCPVVASAAGGARAFVDGANGVLVDPGDATAVTRAVERWATDPDALGAASEAARATARAHPTWAETVTRARALLRSLV